LYLNIVVSRTGIFFFFDASGICTMVFCGHFRQWFSLIETTQFITGFHVFNEGCLKYDNCLSPETEPSHKLILKLQRQICLCFLGDGITSKKMLNWSQRRTCASYILTFQVMFPFKLGKAYDLQNLLSFHSYRVFRILYRFSFYVFRLGFLLGALYKNICRSNT
jgi:hypothetical protein